MAGVYQHASDWIPGVATPFSGVIRVADGKFIACAAGSQDWQDYLTWAAADVANVPDPFLSPAAGGVPLVLAPEEVPYGAMLESVSNPELPGVTDIPHVQGTGTVGEALTCTMGNWTGEPTSYAFRWINEVPEDLSSTDSYVVAATDVGHTISCVVTATNVAGSTTCAPSNGVVAIAAPTDLPGTEMASRTVPPPAPPAPEPTPEAEEHHRSPRHERGNHRR